MTHETPTNDQPLSDEPPGDEPLELEELLGWAEFACWTTLALAPFLYWVNGPAVSHDQFVVRSGLVTIVLVGAVSLRARRFVQAQRRPNDSE